MMFWSISCPCVPRLDSYLIRLVFKTFADIKSPFALRTLAAVGCLRPNDDRLPTSPPAGHEHRNCRIETNPRLLGQKWAPHPPHCDRIRSVRNSHFTSQFSQTETLNVSPWGTSTFSCIIFFIYNQRYSAGVPLVNGFPPGGRTCFHSHARRPSPGDLQWDLGGRRRQVYRRDRPLILTALLM